MSTWFIEAEVKPGTALSALIKAVGRNPNHCPARNRFVWRCNDVGEANRIFVALHDCPHVANVSRRLLRKNLGAIASLALALILIPQLVRADAPCPLDRPHVAMVVTGQNCTTAMCLGKLNCGDPGTGFLTCQYGPALDCNKCTPVMRKFCLSDKELQDAKK